MKFKSAGISCECISSRLNKNEIKHMLHDFKTKKIMVLTHCDMISEGVDIPGIEVLIMLKKTSSLSNYRQWIGRALRKSEGKDVATIIDHVGNVIDHGFPDEDINWEFHSKRQIKKQTTFVCDACNFVNKFGNLSCINCLSIFDVKKIERINKQYEDDKCEKIIHADLEEKTKQYAIDLEKRRKRLELESEKADEFLFNYLMEKPRFHAEIINKARSLGISKETILIKKMKYGIQTHELRKFFDFKYPEHEFWYQDKYNCGYVADKELTFDYIINHEKIKERINMLKNIDDANDVINKLIDEEIPMMEKNRTIAPDFWRDDNLFTLSMESRLLFIGIQNFCDDHGAHPLLPTLIKSLIFSGDDLSEEDILNYINELIDNGFIDIYEIDKKKYIRVKSFSQHNKHKKILKILYPQMSEETNELYS